MVTDIHMHVIPDVDDGSRTMEESMEMLRLASAQGVDIVFATPHSFALDDCDTADIYSRFLILKDRAASLPVSLFFGCEMYCSSKSVSECIQRIRQGVYPTMNNTKYVLTEFSPYAEFEDICFCVKQLLEVDLIPIIAHMERCLYVSLEDVTILKALGADIQINAYSIAEEHYELIREKANTLLSASLVDYIGSDAHRINHRPPDLLSGITAIRTNLNGSYADSVLFRNSHKLT